MLDTLLKVFGKITGSGRAWALQIDPIRSILKSLLSINTETKEQFDRVLLQAFPDLCHDDVIPLWEETLGLTPLSTQTIDERRLAVFSRWISVGGQSKGYIQKILESSFPDIEVLEDLRLAEGGYVEQKNLIQNPEIDIFPLKPWETIGSCIMARSTFSHSDRYSLYCSKITDDISGPGQNITKYNVNGDDLTIDVWVYIEDTCSNFVIAIKNSYVDKDDEIINVISSENPTANTWVNITGSINIEWDGQIIKSEIVFYTDDDHPSFFIDDVNIEYSAFSDSILYDGSFFGNGQLVIDAITGETLDPISDPLTAKQESKVFKIQDNSGFPLVISYEEKAILDSLLLLIKPAHKICLQRIAVMEDKTDSYFAFDGNPDGAGFGQFTTENILDSTDEAMLDSASEAIESVNVDEIDADVGGKFTSNFLNDRRGYE